MAKKKSQQCAALRLFQVWFITGFNDEHDIRCGGSPYFGPYIWVPEQHVSDFIEHMKPRYAHRCYSIKTGNAMVVTLKTVPALEYYIQQFEQKKFFS